MRRHVIYVIAGVVYAKMDTPEVRTNAAGRATGRLRSRSRVNYREANDLRLPRAERVQARSEELFPVEVIAKEAKRVKVHFVGYSSKFDEWRDENELESVYTDEVIPQAAPKTATSDDTTILTSGECSFEPFSLHNNLKLKVKQSLSCTRKSSPEVRIVVPFDAITFNGGLRLLGTQSKKTQGVQHYKIHYYHDLNPLLGKNWHYRGLNANGDYGYVILETVDFYLRKCKPLQEYIPGEQDDEPPRVSLVNTGHQLTFTFVCGYGSRTTFGKDKDIFY